MNVDDISRFPNLVVPTNIYICSLVSSFFYLYFFPIFFSGSFPPFFFLFIIVCFLPSFLFVTSTRSFCLSFLFTYLLFYKLSTLILVLFLFISLYSCRTSLELIKFKNVFSVVANCTGHNCARHNCAEPFSPLPINVYGFMHKFKLTFILIHSLILLQCQYQRMNFAARVVVLYGFSLCTSCLTVFIPDNLSCRDTFSVA
jgi:hypothetical protein